MACISRRELIRDRAAKAAYRAALIFGLQVYWKNPGQDHIPLWATVEGGSESLGLLGGETSVTRFTLWIPRQGDACSGNTVQFPPAEGLMTGAVVFINDVAYAVDVSFDAESPAFAPVFRVDCKRFDITVEVDGIDKPTA